MHEINSLKEIDGKHYNLPIARIKKIMKMDDSVQSCVMDCSKFKWIDDWFWSTCRNSESMRIVYPRINIASMDSYRRE